MQFLVYEHVTGGGLLSGDAADVQSLQTEGDAMACALAADFAAIPGAEVHLLRDARLPSLPLPIHIHRVSRPEDELATLRRLAMQVDWTVLIAPEFDNILLERARLVEDAGGRLLSPSARVIEICTDKRGTKRHLAAAGIPVPSTLQADGSGFSSARARPSFVGPAVLKRVDGAGSVGMKFIESPGPELPPPSGRWMLEEFRPGISASVAVLCGPGGNVLLPPFVQHLQPGTFAYQGGSRLEGRALRSRAEGLAARVADALPSAVGYLGVDLVLGQDPAGGEDVVIEVNPRLTTSWVGLRAIACTNLAEAMLAVAEGRLQVPEFAADPISFLSDGTVLGGRKARAARQWAC